MRREWIEIKSKKFSIAFTYCLPPCGGSGLKCQVVQCRHFLYLSPSMRREWIEIKKASSRDNVNNVSLHAEGVD